MLLRIENDYADGYSEVTQPSVPEPEPMPADEDERMDWEWDSFAVHTGTGRSGDAFYTVTVLAAEDESLVGRVFDFSG